MMENGLILFPEEDPFIDIVSTVEAFAKISKSTIYKYDDEIPDFNVIKEKSADKSFIISWYDPEFLLELPPLSNLNIPFILQSGDSWSRFRDNKLIEVVNKHKPKIIMTLNHCCIQAFKDYLDNPNQEFVYLPNAFNPNIMNDYGQDKIWDITLTGKFSNYNDRRMVDDILKRMNSRGQLKYLQVGRTKTQGDYAKILNSGKISFNSMQNTNELYYKDYFIGTAFAKIFEIPACKSCLISKKFGDADYLGFKDGVNSILYQEDKEFVPKLMYYLQHKDELEKITEEGYKLVHENYTLDMCIIRALNEMEKIINGI